MSLIFQLLLISSITYGQDKNVTAIMSTYDRAAQVLDMEIKKNRINIPHFRSKSCPLTSVKGEDIYKKFKGLEEGLNATCINSNKTAISTLNQSLQGLDGMYRGYQTHRASPGVYDSKGKLIDIPKPSASESEEVWAKYNTDVAERDRLIRDRGMEEIALKNVSTALDSFAKMSENKDCKSSLSKEMVFNLVSDIIIQTSSIGLLTPNPNGYLIAAGGIAVGSMLKIINELLKEQFDWSNREARDSFLRVNCGFFDLKKEMDSMGILHVRIGEHTGEIQAKRGSLKKLEPLLMELYRNEAALAKKNKIIYQSILLGRMGEDNYKLLYNLNMAKQQLELVGPHMNNIEDKGDFLKKIYAIHGEILKHLAKADVGKFGRQYLLESSIVDFVKILGGAKNEDEFFKIYLTNNTLYKSLLENFLTPIEWVYNYQKNLERTNYFKAKGLAELVKDPLFKHKMLIWKYENIIDYYQTRIKFLNHISNDTVFSPDDDGTRIKANIIENFRSIEEKIYGKIGGTFTKYILEKAEKDFREFDRDFKKVLPLFESRERLSTQDLAPACSNAKRMQLLWNSAHSLVNLSYDFMETNKDSFYRPKKRTKMFLFIPYGKSDQQMISDNAQSAFSAIEMLSKKNLDQKKLPKGSLGSFMIKLEAEKPNLAKAQKFSDANNCARWP